MSLSEKPAVYPVECEQCEERKAQAPAVLIPAKGRPQWNPDYTGPLQGVFYAMPPCPEEGAYHTACDSLEAAISARVAAGKEPGPQGSLVEAIEWAYRRLDMLEAAAEGAVRLAVENERLKAGNIGPLTYIDTDYPPGKRAAMRAYTAGWNDCLSKIRGA